jgi:hypothetical protein
MARKLITSKPPRPNNAAPETLSRRSQPPVATLYLMQLRAQALKIAPPDCIRLEVTAEIGMDEDEQPVKIVWINDDQ